jgi:hypothetical protein
VKVLRNVGFHEEGILRDWGYWKGNFRDVRCLSLLRRDLPAAPEENTALSRLVLRLPVPPGIPFAAATVPAHLAGR